MARLLLAAPHKQMTSAQLYRHGYNGVATLAHFFISALRKIRFCAKRIIPSKNTRFYRSLPAARTENKTELPTTFARWLNAFRLFRFGRECFHYLRTLSILQKKTWNELGAAREMNKASGRYFWKKSFAFTVDSLLVYCSVLKDSFLFQCGTGRHSEIEFIKCRKQRSLIQSLEQRKARIFI